VNSGITSIYILTQYKVQPIIEHLHRGSVHRLGGPRSFIEAVPARMQIGKDWYRGTADAVYQNLNLIRQFEPHVVVIFGADHVYKMNIRQMVDFHLDVGAKATVACIAIPRSQASALGIMKVNERSRVETFVEKPADPPGMPDNPEFSLASMGNYVFEPKTLIDTLMELARVPETSYDFGRDVFPALTNAGEAYPYNFMENRVPGPGKSGEQPYWRDVGTIEAYFEANLDLKEVQPGLNLYNWPCSAISMG
jgi:glucose-1-phosphate adenylyltransferase